MIGGAEWVVVEGRRRRCSVKAGEMYERERMRQGDVETRQQGGRGRQGGETLVTAVSQKITQESL